jgi:hypothetical protein
MKNKTTKNAAAADSADLSFDRKAAEARDLLGRILALVEAREAAEKVRRADGRKTRWDVVGSLAHTNEQLAIVLAGLGDRSAVDAKGISY